MPRAYISLNLAPGTPNLNAGFKDTKTKEHSLANAHARMYDPQVDPSFEYLSHDEVAIVHACAKVSPGNWLDLHAHTGWTSAHIASASGIAEVVSLDPEFGNAQRNPTKDAKQYLERFKTNIAAALGNKSSRVHPITGDAKFLAAQLGKVVGTPAEDKLDGVVIHAHQTNANPVEDVKALLPFIEDNGIVIFSGGKHTNTQEAVKFLVSKNFKYKVYKTINLLIVCWRGDAFKTPGHTPDPMFRTESVNNQGFSWDGWLKGIKFSLTV